MDSPTVLSRERLGTELFNMKRAQEDAEALNPRRAEMSELASE